MLQENIYWFNMTRLLARYDEMVAAAAAAAAGKAAKVAASYVVKLSKVVEADKVLKRGNYQKWSAYIKNLLESQHLWDVVDGSDDSGAHDRETKRTSAFQTIRKVMWRRNYSLLLHAIQKEGVREWSFGRNGNFWENTVVYLEKKTRSTLHVAVGLGRVNFVKDLLSKMIPEELEMKTRQGSASISIAAESNNMEIVEMMVKLNPGLLQIENEHGHIPLVTSAVNANEEMICCIYKMTSVEKICEMSDKCVTFLTAAARLEAYDIVLDLLQRRPEYGITQDDCEVTLLSVMAEKPSAFPSGNRGSLQYFIRQSG
ncbi:hypothetical protein MKX01_003290 [Papaver californicum]|nr:hypothetical protein MKX01_003290 [Papaver californicum]